MTAADSALREREERLRLALQAARAGAWELDLVNGRSWFDERIAAIFGRPAGQIEGSLEEATAAIHPDDRGWVTAATVAALRERREYDFVHRIVRTDGTVRWTEVRARPDFDADGRAVRIRGVSIDVTEHREAEEAARRELATRAELGAVFERVTDAFVALDRDWRYVYMNRRAGELFGRDPAAMIGRHIWTEFPEGPGQPFAQAYRRAMETQQSITLEDYYAPWDRWFENRIYPSPAGLSVYFHEITDRKRAERTLRDSERRKEALIANLPGIVYRCRNDAHWTMDYISPAVARVTGYPAEVFTAGRVHFELLIDEADRGAVRRAVEDGLARRGPYAMDYRIRRADGEERWVSERGTGLWSDDGTLEALEGFIEDITERRAADERLRAATLRLQTIVQAANVGLWDWDLPSNSVYFSPEWKRQLGYAEHEVADEVAEWQNRVHPEDLAGALARIREYIANPWPGYQLELRMRHRDGSWRWMLATGALLRGADGTPVRMLGAHLDVTEHKRAEREVRESQQRVIDLIDGLGPHIFVGLLAVDGTLLEVNRSALAAANVRREDVLGKPVYETPWIAHSPRVQKQFRDAVAAAAGGTVRSDMQLAVAGGAQAWIDFTLHPLRDSAGTIRYLVASGAVITERKLAEDGLRRTAEQLDAAQERAHLGSWELNLETGETRWSREMFRLFRRESAQGAPTPAEFMGFVDPRDRDLIEDIPRKVAAAGGSVSLEYSTSPERGPVRRLSVVVYGAPDADGRVRRLAGTVLDVTARKMAEDELRRAADRMQALSRRLVDTQEAEQRRMSIELHDRIGQNLTALGINLRLVEGTLPEPLAQQLAPRLADSRTLLESTVASVRSLITDLRPAALEDYGLLAGLRQLGREFEQRTHIASTVAGADLQPRLAPPVELALFRIAQEALNNTAKYAGAQHVTLELTCDDARAALTIADDGVGFDVAAAPAEPRQRWGLLMMRERAEAVGGRLQVASTPGRGTQVRVEVARAA